MSKEKTVSVSKNGKMKQVIIHTEGNGKNRKGQTRIISQTKHVPNNGQNE